MNVFKTEEGEYGTIPDGDKPSIEQIIQFEIEQGERNENVMC